MINLFRSPQFDSLLLSWLGKQLNQPKEQMVLESGRRAYRSEMIVELHWVQANVFQFDFEDENVVRFYPDSKLVFSRVDCSCSHTEVLSFCWHKSACLWALADIFIFKPTHLSWYKELADSFWGKDDADSNDLEATPSFRLTIHLNQSPWEKLFKMTFYSRGLPVGHYENNIPPILRESCMRHQGQETALFKYLAAGGSAEILIHTELGKQVATWDPQFRVTGRLKVEWGKREKIKLTRLATTERGAALKLFYLLGKKLIFDPESGKLGVLSPSPSWDFLSSKVNLAERDPRSSFDNGFRDSARELHFSKLSLEDVFLFEGEIAEKFEDHFDVSVGKSQVTPLRAQVGYRLSLLFSKETGQMQIVPSLTQGDSPIELPMESLCRFLSTEQLSKSHDQESYYRNRLRVSDVKLLQGALVDMAMTELDAERTAIVSECLKKFPFRKHWRDRSLRARLKNFFKSYGEFLKEEKVLQLHEINGQVSLIEINPQKVQLLLGLCAKVFDYSTKQILLGDTESISRRKLFLQLSTLKKLYDQFEIPIFFDRKAIQAPRVDIKIFANHPSGQNWFEVHPEIKIGNETISLSEIATATFENGFLQTANSIQLLDESAQALLEKVAKFFKSRGTLSVSSQTTEQGSSIGEWVQVKPLEILDWAAMRDWGVQVDLPEEDEALLQKLMRFKKIKIPPLPEYFSGELRHYQLEGYAWLAFLYEHKLGACLADDMGLGKTVQAIAFLGALFEGKVKSRSDGVGKPHLIVMPSSLLFNWESELKRFYPKLKFLLHTSSNQKFDVEGVDLILTTYDLLRRDIENFKKVSFHTAWFDEAQMIKNLFARRTQAVRSIQALFKVCLSGTPLENHIGEYYSVMDLCVPGLLGNYELFRSQVSKDDLGLLTKRTRPFVLRRTKEKVLTDLPAKTEMDVYLPMEDEQRLIYAKAAEEVKLKIEEAFAKKAPGQARIIALTGLLRLRQICVTPELIQPKWQESSPKTIHLLEKLHELQDEGHSALVFSQFTSYLDCLQRALVKAKISFLRLDGSTPLLERKKRVESFQSGDRTQVFLVSLKAGGFGLNLTRANYVFHMDPWWNPAVDRQASDRVHRIGQEKKVFITRLLMKHTVEEKVMAMRKTKWDLFQSVMQDGGSLQSGLALSKADFDFLLET